MLCYWGNFGLFWDLGSSGIFGFWGFSSDFGLLCVVGLGMDWAFLLAWVCVHGFLVLGEGGLLVSFLIFLLLLILAGWILVVLLIGLIGMGLFCFD